MRQRVGRDAPPPGLLIFDGTGYATAQAWDAAFDEFHEARDAWLAARGLTELEVAGFDYVIVGGCPFDPESI